MQDAMRLRSGWHHTEQTEEGAQRFSVEGFVDESWNEVLTARADGNVGVGTWDPLEALHVVGNGYVEGDVLIGPAAARFKAGFDGEAAFFANVGALAEPIVAASRDAVSVPSASDFLCSSATRAPKYSSSAQLPTRHGTE